LKECEFYRLPQATRKELKDKNKGLALGKCKSSKKTKEVDIDKDGGGAGSAILYFFVCGCFWQYVNGSARKPPVFPRP
jgi:hypothetical protein